MSVRFADRYRRLERLTRAHHCSSNGKLCFRPGVFFLSHVVGGDQPLNDAISRSRGPGEGKLALELPDNSGKPHSDGIKAAVVNRGQDLFGGLGSLRCASEKITAA